jgi:hypothetical protein
VRRLDAASVFFGFAECRTGAAIEPKEIQNNQSGVKPPRSKDMH